MKNGVLFLKRTIINRISLDGDELANKYRKDKQGKDTLIKCFVL